MKIVAIIPALNEEQAIGQVIQGLKNYTKSIIVIDDGSTDQTKAISEKLGAKVYSNIVNKGLGYSIRKGYLKALADGADIILQVDADGQYTLEDIPKLIEPIKNNEADLVLASRFKGGIQTMPFSKKLGNQIGTFVTNLVSNAKVSDAQTGFRAIRRETVMDILPRSNYTYVQETIIKAKKEGWRIKEVPSYFKKRDYGQSKLISNIFSYAKNALLILIQVFCDINPLVIFSSLGALFLLAGLVYGSYLVSIFWATGQIGKIPSVVLTAVLLVGGIQLILFGFLADRIKDFRKELREFRKF